METIPTIHADASPDILALAVTRRHELNLFHSKRGKLAPNTQPKSVAHPNSSHRIANDTGGKGSFTQWVHCEFIVSFEAIGPVVTQQVCDEFF